MSRSMLKSSLGTEKLFIILLLIHISETSNIYGNVGDDVSFIWTLDPLPNGIAVVSINNPLDIIMFRASSVTGIVNSGYQGRIVYNGDTTKGQMRFTLKSITRRDAGLYTTVYNAGITYPGQTLYVYGKPNKPWITETSPPVVNSNLLLSCSTSSTTVPSNHGLLMSYSWNINAANFSTSVGRYTVSDSRFTIQNVQLNDINLTVTCTATEQGGLSSDTSSFYTIDPSYGPGTVTFSPTTEAYSIKEHETIADITCGGNCKPNCNYTWTKDGQVTSHGTGRTLSLRNISRNDTGVYRCTAMNEYGTKNSSDIIVDVLYGPRTIKITPSTTTYSPKEQGSIPDIICSADCKPNCSFRWTKDNGQVTSSGSTLSLRNINRHDAGVYRCTALNDHGTKNSRDLHVDVLYGPSVVNIFPSTTSYSKRIGDTIPNITCSAVCNPTCEFSWRKGSQAASHGYGNTLQLTNLQRTDNGVYSCKAWNDYRQSMSVEIDVDILFGPDPLQFTPTDLRHTINEGETLPSITCSAVCNPNCTYTWQHPDGSSTSDKTLNLGRVDRNDQGIYSCIAQNEISNRSKQLEIVVQYGPGNSIRLVPAVTVYIYTENMTMSDPVRCDADCRPNCNYRWNTTSTTNPLIFGKIDRNKAGDYVCIASNAVSSSRISVQLIVQYPAKVRMISVIGGNSSVMENQKTIFQCLVDAVPLPSAIWSKDNGTVFATSGNISNPSLLIINHTNCMDRGIYKCSVNNHITDHPSDSKTIELKVFCGPRIHHGLQQSEIIRKFLKTGELLNLTVQYIAYPVATFQWSLVIYQTFEQIALVDSKDGYIIQNKAFRYWQTSSLMKTTTFDNAFGTYIVKVTNVIGSALTRFIIEAERAPDSVANILAVCFGASKANVSWDPQSDGGLQQYFIIQYREKTSNKFKNWTKLVPNYSRRTSVILTGLSEKTEYAFRIIAKNSIGETVSATEGICTLTGTEEQLSVGFISGLSIIGTLVFVGVIIAVIVALWRSGRCEYCLNDRQNKRAVRTSCSKSAAERNSETNYYDAIIVNEDTDDKKQRDKNPYEDLNRRDEGNTYQDILSTDTDAVEMTCVNTTFRT